MMKIHTVELPLGEPGRHEVVRLTDHGQALAKMLAERDTVLAQMAEANTLLNNVMNCTSFREIGEVEMAIAAYFARNAQVEQQEAPKREITFRDLLNIPTCQLPREEEAQGAQAVDAPKIPPMGKLDIPARGVPLNECHSCGWLGGENEVPGEEDQCYCPNCRSDNIDDDLNLPRLFHLVRYLARAALATQPAADSLPPEISRSLMGRIVDEVFDGGIEDSSVISDIYRVIARECSPEARGAEHDQ